MVKSVTWTLGAVLALVGCGTERTEIVVVIDSDLAVPDELDAIRVQVTGPDGSTKNAGAMLGPGETPLPRTLGLVHEDGPLSPVRILVTGRSGDSDVIERRATTAFIEGRTLLLRMDLLRSCVAVVCDADQSCLSGSCRSAEVDPGSLPEWQGQATRLDASTPPVDAGSPEPDAGDCTPTDETCNDLDDDCDDNVDEGFDFMSDPDHCGECGNACRPPNRACCEGTCGRC